MERLTEKSFGVINLKCSNSGCSFKCGDCEKLDDAVVRLAAYEDTGLSPDDVVDLMGNHGMALSELAKHFVQVEPTILHIRGDIPTVYGYDAKHLALIAEMLRKQLISKDMLARAVTDFETMYRIICQEHQMELKKEVFGVAYEAKYPSAAEVATWMLPPVRHELLTGSWQEPLEKERLWNDLREHSGLLEE